MLYNFNIKDWKGLLHCGLTSRFWGANCNMAEMVLEVVFMYGKVRKSGAPITSGFMVVLCFGGFPIFALQVIPQCAI